MLGRAHDLLLSVQLLITSYMPVSTDTEHRPNLLLPTYICTWYQDRSWNIEPRHYIGLARHNALNPAQDSDYAVTARPFIYLSWYFRRLL